MCPDLSGRAKRHFGQRFGLAKPAGFLKILKLLPAYFPKGGDANLVLYEVAHILK